MNRILIIIIAVISAYLIYGSFSEDEKVDLEQVVVVKETNLPITTELDDPSFENSEENLNESYTLSIKSDLGETNQELDLNSDNTFQFRRYVILPKSDKRDTTATGTYSIVKNDITLNFDSNRDVDVFPENVITLKMKKNGNLKYGIFILEKQ